MRAWPVRMMRHDVTRPGLTYPPNSGPQCDEAGLVGQQTAREASGASRRFLSRVPGTAAGRGCPTRGTGVGLSPVSEEPSPSPHREQATPAIRCFNVFMDSSSGAVAVVEAFNAQRYKVRKSSIAPSHRWRESGQRRFWLPVPRCS
jgi:hypothetical protein